MGFGLAFCSLVLGSWCPCIIADKLRDLPSSFPCVTKVVIIDRSLQATRSRVVSYLNMLLCVFV